MKVNDKIVFREKQTAHPVGPDAPVKKDHTVTWR
jgi:hypothetical protein